MAIGELLPALGGELFAAAIFIATVAVAGIVALVIRRYVKAATAKTKTVLDDMLIKALGKPLLLGILVAGSYASLQVLPEAAGYLRQIELVYSVLMVLLAAFTTVRTVNALIEWYVLETAKKMKIAVDKNAVPMLKKVVYAFVYAIALLWMLDLLGVEITTLIAALGIGGIAVALALQSTLTNLFAGAYLAIDRPVKIGDYIELDSGQKGYVQDIGWRSVRILTLPNNLVVIPNSKLAESIIINYHSPKKELAVVVPCGVAYGSDLEKVERVTVAVATKIQQTVEGAIKEFEPFIRYNEFGESNINFSIILRVKEYVDRYLVMHELIKALKKEYDRENIEISFPARNVYMRK